MSKPELIAMTNEVLEQARQDTMVLADEVMAISASEYTDTERYQLEIDNIFKRVPLMLAPSVELPEPGSYKAMDVVGIPVLITRQKSGDIKAFLNACTHRGNPVAEGTGSAERFMCKYHGWTFKNDGALQGISAPQDFGKVDKANLCLKQFPAYESAGFIWVILDPNSKLSIENFLCGYDKVLEELGAKDMHLFASRSLDGPNWKTAYDGYLDFYHLPVLHQAFAHLSNRSHIFEWGPHQRNCQPTSIRTDPAQGEIDLLKMKPEDWPEAVHTDGIWTIFPHISVATFYGGLSKCLFISILTPGATVEESVTYQYYLTQEKSTDPESIAGAQQEFDMLESVVRDEDYATGKRQHKALQAGLLDKVYFGRNEQGNQLFHGWVNRIIKASDQELIDIFAADKP